MKVRERSLLIIIITSSLLVGIGIGLIVAANFLPNVGVASSIITWSGAVVGIVTLFYHLIKDVLDSKKRGSLNYGQLRVSNTTEERQSKTLRISTYLLEVLNKNENTVAQDCKCFIDLSAIGLARLTGSYALNLIDSATSARNPVFVLH